MEVSGHWSACCLLVFTCRITASELTRRKGCWHARAHVTHAHCFLIGQPVKFMLCIVQSHAVFSTYNCTDHFRSSSEIISSQRQCSGLCLLLFGRLEIWLCLENLYFHATGPLPICVWWVFVDRLALVVSASPVVSLKKLQLRILQPEILQGLRVASPLSCLPWSVGEMEVFHQSDSS